MKALQSIIAVSLLFSSAPSFAQDAKLIEAAKKEGGKVVAYGSLEGDTTDAVRKAFEQKTGLTLEYWRASTTKVVDRATGQIHVGKVPPYSVVVPGNIGGGPNRPSTYCAVIVKTVDERTRSKTSINELLRD